MIEIKLAKKEDVDKLVNYLKHYRNDGFNRKKQKCYTSHNHTIIVCDSEKIVGLNQWYVKENPQDGLVEFEELHILEDYRGKGIATKLAKFSIESVKEHFAELNIEPKGVYVFITKGNVAVEKLLVNLGFEKKGKVNDFFKIGETQLVYIYRF